MEKDASQERQMTGAHLLGAVPTAGSGQEGGVEGRKLLLEQQMLLPSPEHVDFLSRQTSWVTGMASIVLSCGGRGGKLCVIQRSWEHRGGRPSTGVSLHVAALLPVSWLWATDLRLPRTPASRRCQQWPPWGQVDSAAVSLSTGLTHVMLVLGPRKGDPLSPRRGFEPLRCK